MNKGYYDPLAEESFNELKELAIEIWKGYDDTYGYATGKINSIKDLENVQDNGMYIFAMFDCVNQNILLSRASDELIGEIRSRLSPVTDEDWISWMSSDKKGSKVAEIKLLRRKK